MKKNRKVNKPHQMKNPILKTGSDVDSAEEELSEEEEIEEEEIIEEEEEDREEEERGSRSLQTG